MKRTLILSLLFCSYISAMEDRRIIRRPDILPKRETVGISRRDGNYIVIRRGKEYRVETYNTDHLLRKLDDTSFAEFVKQGTIRVKELDEHEYRLTTHVPGYGGGILGATIGVVGGKMLVHGTAQVIYFSAAGLVGIFCPPAAPIVLATLEATFTAPVEAASNVVAVGMGIALGSATGPV
jgi:hypothetical protein